MTSPKIIGVRFGNNYFHNTILPLLKCIGEQGIDNYVFTKEKFVELFNRAAPSFYYLCQRLDYVRKDDSNVKKCFYIKEKDVFFDDEVRQALNTGVSLFVLDTNNFLRDPYVYSA